MLAAVILAISVLYSAVQIYELKSTSASLDEQRVELENRKQELEQEKDEIAQKKAYMQTDEYVEDVAREKFGLVYSDEIVFKAK